MYLHNENFNILRGECTYNLLVIELWIQHFIEVPKRTLSCVSSEWRLPNSFDSFVVICYKYCFWRWLIGNVNELIRGFLQCPQEEWNDRKERDQFSFVGGCHLLFVDMIWKTITIRKLTLLATIIPVIIRCYKMAIVPKLNLSGVSITQAIRYNN